MCTLLGELNYTDVLLNYRNIHQLNYRSIDQCCVPPLFPADLRQELAVRERTTDSTRMSAPSSPTLDIDKMDTAVQASLSLPATPVGKNIDHPFITQKGTRQS